MFIEMVKTVFGAAILAACGYGLGAKLGFWNGGLFGAQESGAVIFGLLVFAGIGASLLPWQMLKAPEKNCGSGKAEVRPSFEPLRTVPFWANPDDGCWLADPPHYEDEIRAIAGDEAQEFFQAFKSAAEINWRVLDRHCEARADMMCELAARRGLRMGKIWASAEPFERLSAVAGMEKKLSVCLDDAGTESAEWNYHVAPTNLMQDKEGGVSMAVFDPGLFDGPVFVPAWRARLSGSDGDLHIVQTERECFHSPHDGGETWAQSLNYRERNAILRELFDIDCGATQSSYLKTLRANYADALLDQSDGRLDELRAFLENPAFRSWWCLKFPENALAGELEAAERYYHLDASALRASFAGEDPMLLGHAIRLSTWRDVGPFILELDRRLKDLRRGRGSKEACAAVKDAYLAKARGEPSTLLNDWHTPFAHALWERLGFQWREFI
jgi:hypothetical protein